MYLKDCLHGSNAALVWKRLLLLGALSLQAGVAGMASAETEKQAFDFHEVYDLLKANLAGVTVPYLDEAAARGLLEQLAGKVSVVGESPGSLPAPTNSLVTA